ncbi:NAD-dependent epimerase/dehydratase family protein [Isoptericola variabilis]|uniref:NAD-dependent epimerase/dehydratase n=1 Tax=Isoptericola variabilis (strain 225) TaxID=743718 RepID=F6FU07_ISOV2|nr:NAD-dependent epimerase/dehydratase family protein [Isoptericola variabilis]AEG45378.1 NAD-dependent epimerase/dehydratase [Isoptericola variabilis 225]TWH30278.1 nucleoside-diphosphate-sugar epimerase [Isoptericola variabilis J7]
MRVVVIGASGNIGTAVLRALAREPVVTSRVGVARRVPRADGSSTVEFPHDETEWVRVDLTDTVDAVTAGLDEALRGADVVVHLAWAIQPSRDRSRLRRVNVDGTRRVVEAVVRNHVPHLVVASSVGAYSRGPADGHPVDEAWPTRGIASEPYSVDKVAVERMLDDLEAARRRPVVTRMRPALVFQRDAATGIVRNFLGGPAALGLRAAAGTPGDVLGGLLRGWRSDDDVTAPDDGARLPLLPFPAGMRLQAVHADDVAEAFRAAIVGRHPGAFNLAADGVLTGQVLADTLAGGRLVEVTPGFARGVVGAAWRARLSAIGAGWFDMGMHGPVLDSTRARTVLRWAPTRTGPEAVREAVDAIVEKVDFPTPPLAR